jgi:hypothetical protein
MMVHPRTLMFRLLALLVAGLVVAACGTAPKNRPVAAEPGDMPAPTAQSVVENGEAAVGEEPVDNGEEDEETGEEREDRTPRINLPEPGLPQLASVPPAADLPGPEGLVGLGADELLTLLGEPEFRRRDAPAELWQYHGEDCFLDVFLFAGKTDDAYRVTHSEARGRTVTSVPLNDCYFSLFGKPAGSAAQ